MKLFDINQIPPKTPPYLALQKQSIDMIIQICKTLQISLPAMHTALWVFHCNTLIMSFHNFDRYIYACGAIVIGTKLMQCLKYPTQILSTCRKILRKKKNMPTQIQTQDEDSQQYLKKQVKKVFEAQVNIMINIGFNFDIRLGLFQAERLGILSVDNLSIKIKQTLTSLYMTQVVVLFCPEVIALLALKLLLKVQNRNIEAMEFTENIKEKLLGEEIKVAEKEYLLRCTFG